MYRKQMRLERTKVRLPSVRKYAYSHQQQCRVISAYNRFVDVNTYLQMQIYDTIHPFKHFEFTGILPVLVLWQYNLHDLYLRKCFEPKGIPICTPYYTK